jgi:hypothetical protein
LILPQSSEYNVGLFLAAELQAAAKKLAAAKANR